MRTLIAVMCCWRSESTAQTIRETWVKGSPVEVKFFFGRGAQRPPRPDEVFLDAPDTYEGFVKKVKCMIRWAVENEYDYLLKCDDDTYVVPDRVKFDTDYAGRWTGSYIHGGSGYVLSRRSMEILRNAPITNISEDMWVTSTLITKGILPQDRSDTQIFQRRVFKDPFPVLPSPHNTLAIVAEFTPPELRKVHHQFSHADEIAFEQMSASEYLKYLKGENHR